MRHAPAASCGPLKTLGSKRLSAYLCLRESDRVRLRLRPLLTMRRLCSLIALTLAVSCSEPSAPDAQKGPPPRGPAKVRAAVAEDRGLEDAWRFLGDVRAGARASVAAGAAGTVTRVRVRVGDPVKRGQLLVEIDPDLAAAQVATAEAEVGAVTEAEAQARREVERLSGLRENVVAEIDRERARSTARAQAAELSRAQAQLREARATLARHHIRAPFDGVVAQRAVDPGDWVKVGDRVLELVSVEDPEIIVDANQALLGRIEANESATALDGRRRAELTVTGVVPALDPVSRTLRVRLVPTAPTPWLLPGMSVDVEFEVALDPGGGAVAVPADALLSSPDETRVIKLVDGAAQPLVVEVLAKAKGTALVRAEGLSAGDQVVTRGNERLRPGQKVEVDNER